MKDRFSPQSWGAWFLWEFELFLLGGMWYCRHYPSWAMWAMK